MAKWILLREVSFWMVIVHGGLFGHYLANENYFTAVLLFLAAICWTVNFVRLGKITRR